MGELLGFPVGLEVIEILHLLRECVLVGSLKETCAFFIYLAKGKGNRNGVHHQADESEQKFVER